MADLGHVVDTDGITGDYASLNALNSAQAQDLTDGGGDTYTATCQASTDVVDSTAVDITGWTVNAASFVTVTASGDMHDGTRGNGYRLESSVAYASTITLSEQYTVLVGLGICNSNINADTALIVNASDCIIKDGLIYDTVTFDTDNKAALTADSGGTIIVNTFIYSCGSGIYSGSGSTYVYNCTILNCSTYGVSTKAYRTTVIKNTYVGGSGSEDLNDGTGDNGNYTVTTCETSDGTEGTTTTSVANCDFTSDTAGSEDGHIGASSQLIGDGTDLSADGIYPFNVDFEGDSRSSWDVGADERVVAGSGVINQLQKNNLGSDLFNGALQ